MNHYLSQASEVILKNMNDPIAYRELALTSFAEFDNRLNWRVAGRRIRPLLEETVARKLRDKFAAAD